MADPTLVLRPALVTAALLGAALAGLRGEPDTLRAEPGAHRPVLVRRARPTAEDTARAAQLLRRATWGARPEDLSAVLRMGEDAWLERQLTPRRIDDGGLAARLEPFAAARLSVPELYAAYPPPARTRADSALRRARPGMRPQRMLAELAGARVARAVHTERQVEDVMADFWFNHFNVFWGKGPDRWLVADYERTAIRPHVFGRFRDLLGATAHHPAMLVYLDNWTSVAPGAAPAMRDSLRRGPRGLNENYARELMELHTLGVDGGYTQADVVAVARAFTGWSVEGLRPIGGDAPAYRFRPRMHDRGEKTVLGQRLPAGRGEEDGEAVLDLLARHPATARHVARRLAERFVSDDPPAALVDRLATVFRDTDGDLRAVTRALFRSPELAAARGTKVRTPLEFVAAALRVSGAEAGPSRQTVQTLRAMGQVPYFETAPTGYPSAREEWTNGGAMIARMEFARSLAEGRLEGLAPAPSLLERLPAEPAALTAALAARVLPGEPLPLEVARTVAGELAAHPELSAEARARRALGLLLGSPSFQRR